MIALITLFQDNFGSILQAFSTKSFVESLGTKCEIFQEFHSQKLYAKIWRRIRIIISKFRYPSIRKYYQLQKKVTTIDKLNPTNETLKLMDIFVRNEFTIRKVFVSEWNKVYPIPLKYDFYITGSDQVWKTIFSVNPLRFLQFVPRKKRIALAASFGISEIPKYHQKDLHKALNGFDYISVREETGVEIVKKYSSAKVCRIADPTFIYNANEWRSFAKEFVVPFQKYILIHFLNEPNDVALESIAWLSKQLNLNVVAIGYKYKSFDYIERFNFMDGGPWEYINMIDKADFVLTDSFHSSLFSINFNKRFFIFHRNYSVSKQTSRISDLLKRFKMENRLISDANVLKKIYLDNQSLETRNILEHERSVIRDFIQKSISGQIPQCFLQGEINV